MKMKFVSLWSVLILALACNLLYAGPTLAAGPTSPTSVAGVTDVTIRNRYKEIREEIEMGLTL